MATGDFYYFGSSGAYNMGDMTAANQPCNVLNTLNCGVLGGLVSSTGTASQTVTAQYVVQPSALVNYLEKVAEPAKKKAKGILAKLKSEIDEWHGDILNRRAYA